MNPPLIMYYTLVKPTPQKPEYFNGCYDYQGVNVRGRCKRIYVNRRFIMECYDKGDYCGVDLQYFFGNKTKFVFNFNNFTTPNLNGVKGLVHYPDIIFGIDRWYEEDKVTAEELGGLRYSFRRISPKDVLTTCSDLGRGETLGQVKAKVRSWLYNSVVPLYLENLFTT